MPAKAQGPQDLGTHLSLLSWSCNICPAPEFTHTTLDAVYSLHSVLETEAGTRPRAHIYKNTDALIEETYFETVVVHVEANMYEKYIYMLSSHSVT